MKRQVILIVFMLAAVSMLAAAPKASPSLSSPTAREESDAAPQAAGELGIRVKMEVACGENEIKDKRFAVKLEEDSVFTKCGNRQILKQEPERRKDLSRCSECTLDKTKKEVFVTCNCKPHPACSKESEGRKPKSIFEVWIPVVARKASGESPAEAPSPFLRQP